MTGYSLFAMSSYFYSVKPLLSLWKGFEVFAAISVFMFIQSLISRLEDVKHFLNILSLIVLFLVVTALVGGLYVPSQAFVRQLGGVGGRFAFEYWGVFPSIHPNTLAQYGAIVAVMGGIHILYSKHVTRRLPGLIVASAGIMALLLAHSRTSMIGLIAAMSAVFVIGKVFPVYKKPCRVTLSAGKRNRHLLLYPAAQNFGHL
jgi:uncharacterized membrane protein